MVPLLPVVGGHVEALRPAWASWIAGVAPWSVRNWVMGVNAVMCASSQMPRSLGVMRPQG